MSAGSIPQSTNGSFKATIRLPLASRECSLSFGIPFKSLALTTIGGCENSGVRRNNKLLTKRMAKGNADSNGLPGLGTLPAISTTCEILDALSNSKTFEGSTTVTVRWQVYCD